MFLQVLAVCLLLKLPQGHSSFHQGPKPVFENIKESARYKPPIFKINSNMQRSQPYVPRSTLLRPPYNEASLLGLRNIKYSEAVQPRRLKNPSIFDKINSGKPTTFTTLDAAQSGRSQKTRPTEIPHKLQKNKPARDVHSGRSFTNWDGEPDNNRIEHDRFPSFGDNIPEKVRPYKAPGDWATPAPDSGIDLGFTPVQTYIQVRKTNKVEHLPQSEALKEASSEDEILNAHRLKEVLRTKKIQEVYSEEGYEDSAYDHGDHERHAESDEGYAKSKNGKFKLKDAVQHIHDVANAESQIVENNNATNKFKPMIKRKRVEATKMKLTYMNDKEKNMERQEENDGPEYHQIEGKKSEKGQKQKQAHKSSNLVKRQQPVQNKPSQLINQHHNSAPKRDFVTPNGDFWSLPNVFEEVSKPGKWSSNNHRKTQKHQNPEIPKAGPQRVRITPIPTYGYIHMLTDAHYGTEAPMTRYLPKPIPSHVINLTEGLKPVLKHPTQGYEARRTKREDEEDEDDSGKYEKELSKEIDQQEKKILSDALKNLQVVNDISEKLPPEKSVEPFSFRPTIPPSWLNTFDTYKYPYFNAVNINPYSPLRYASHPREFPKKSGYGMEFYDSRDREIECDPVSVDLAGLQKSNATKHNLNQSGKRKRIIALGDKIQCLKIKYFGEDPLDSPFFKEDELLKQAAQMKPRVDEGLKYVSTYLYKPNRTMDVFVKEKAAASVINNNISSGLNDSKVDGTEDNKVEVLVMPTNPPNTTQQYRVIPVTENYLQITTPLRIVGMKPPPLYQRPLPFSVIKLPPRPMSRNPRQKIQYRHNCLHPIMKMIITERSDDDHEIIFDCRDAIFIETIRQGQKHIKIIPKIRRSDVFDALVDESNQIRAGEVVEGNAILLNRAKRATPSPMPRKKSNLFPNKGLLDKIVKKPKLVKTPNQLKNPSSLDLGDRSPDEIEYISSTTTVPITTSTPKLKQPMTTQTTTTTTTAKPAQRKMEVKPLSRLSGKDFLDRYHKTKVSKVPAKSSKTGFWSVPDKKQREEIKKEEPKSSEEEIKEEATSYAEQRDEVSPTPVLLYIVDEATGRGQWVSEPTTDSFLQTSETTLKEGVLTNVRSQKKQDARRKFFAKKLKKTL